MKLIHVNTREKYDALMDKLDEKGYVWTVSVNLTEFGVWDDHEKDTVIALVGNTVRYGSLPYFKRHYPNVKIEEYEIEVSLDENAYYKAFGTTSYTIEIYDGFNDEEEKIKDMKFTKVMDDMFLGYDEIKKDVFDKNGLLIELNDTCREVFTGDIVSISHKVDNKLKLKGVAVINGKYQEWLASYRDGELEIVAKHDDDDFNDKVLSAMTNGELEIITKANDGKYYDKVLSIIGNGGEYK